MKLRLFTAIGILLILAAIAASQVTQFPGIFTNSGGYPVVFTTTGSTNITLPTSGTLATNTLSNIGTIVSDMLSTDGKVIGWSGAAMSKLGTQNLAFGNGTQGDASANLSAAGFKAGGSSATASLGYYTNGASIGSGQDYSISSVASAASPDAFLFRLAANKWGVGSAHGTNDGAFNAALVNYGSTENGATNAIACSAGCGPTLTPGLKLTILLAHTLQAGANTFAYNGGAALGIKSHRNTANNIGTAYASGGIIELSYDGTQWEDLSQ